MFLFIFLISFINIVPNLCNNLNPIIVPNTIIYQKKIYIPIVGKQIIEAEVITNNHAYLKLEGLINEKGTVKYINDNNKSSSNFLL